MRKTKNKKETISIPDEMITGKIYLIRGKKVMFDRDLAALYGVENKALNQAVKRNAKRFPEDFMFQLNKQEAEIFSRFQFGTLNENLKHQIGTSSLRSQIVTLKNGDLRSKFVTLRLGRGKHLKYSPHVFTEQGVAMLSSVLKSDRAIQVNIQIMRTFTKLREMLLTHKELREKIERMERKYDSKFKVIFDVIKKLLEDKKPEKANKIGFR